MIRRLADESCVACRGGERPLSGEDLASLCETLNLWRLENHEGVARIARSFAFRSLFEVQAFVDRLADLAAREDHHPEVVQDHTRVTVVWWTHVIRGLHRNDFIMAAKTDRLAG